MATNIFPSTTTPELRGTALPTYFGMNNSQLLPGFASSAGSAIELPINNTNPIVAKTVTGATIWTFTPAQVTAAVAGTVTDFTGWYLNDAATLLNCVGYDTATSPDTFMLFTIDVAGTIVQVGVDQPATDFNDAPTWAGRGSIQPDGTGFKILSSPGASGDPADAQFAIIDSSGQFTTDPTALYTNAEGLVGSPVYETPNGKLFGPAESDTTDMNTRVYISNKTDSAQVFLPFDSVKTLGVLGTLFIRWRDYVTSIDVSGDRVEGRFEYTEAQMDAYANEVLIYGGTPT